MPRHIERWQAPASMQKWRAHVAKMVTFAKERPAIQRHQLREYFDLKNSYTVRVSVNDERAGTVKLNTLHLGLADNELTKPVAASASATHMTAALAFPWQGEYFQDLPISLEAVPKPGYQFSHWEVSGRDRLEPIEYRNQRLGLRPQKNLSIYAVFQH